MRSSSLFDFSFPTAVKILVFGVIASYGVAILRMSLQMGMAVSQPERMTPKDNPRMSGLLDEDHGTPPEGLVLSSTDGDFPVTSAVARMQLNPKTNAHVISSLWEKAILEAEDLLPKNSSKTLPVGHLPSCLIPDKARTAALVREAVAKANKVGSSYKPPNNRPTTGSVSLLPLPVLNMGMPKVGSTTLFQFFKCIGFAATHWKKKAFNDQLEGPCMRDAVMAGRPPLATCAYEKDALMQIDAAIKQTKKQRGDCFFPQLSLLEEIHNENPHATFIVNFRPVQDWMKSLLKWRDYLGRLRTCDLPNLPAGYPEDLNVESDTMDTLMKFFCSHILHLRQFVELHPSHALIELDLYDTKGSKEVMAALFPSSPGKEPSSTCWGHGNVSKTHKQRMKEKERKENKRKAVNGL